MTSKQILQAVQMFCYDAASEKIKKEYDNGILSRGMLYKKVLDTHRFYESETDWIIAIKKVIPLVDWTDKQAAIKRNRERNCCKSILSKTKMFS